MNNKDDRKLKQLTNRVIVLITALVLLIGVICFLAIKNARKKELIVIDDVKPQEFCGTPKNEIPALFKANCLACHKLDNYQLVGPGLKGCFDRFPYDGWFEQYMLNQDSLVLSGEPYILSLKETFQVSFDHRLIKLTDTELVELETLLKDKK